MKSPILGGYYATASPNVADNRLINLYPEAVPEGGKTSGFLTRCPGLTRKVTVGSGPIRGMIKAGDKGYIVSGQELYSIDSSYSATALGTITGSGPVSLSYNGLQIFIAVNPEGYIYDIDADSLGQIIDGDFPGAVTVAFLDQYFVFNEPDSQRFWVTSPLDGTAIDALEFASSEGSPDLIVALEVDHREVWVFGTNSIEIYYNSGELDFPLSRIQGAFIEVGCAAAYSIAKLDNSLFWLGADDRGNGVVYRATGYSAARVSDHSIEAILEDFEDVSDAIGYSYQQGGHAFYILTFPSSGYTLAYDVATQKWHRRAAYRSGNYTRHRGNCQMNFNGKVHIGDSIAGNIYTFDLDVYVDDDEAQRWLRSWRAIPPNLNSLKEVIHHQLIIDCEAGVGINSGQGEDALFLLRWSDDGGHTWTNYREMTFGKIGKYIKRVTKHRLGKTRDRIYEVSGTDPNRIKILGAELRLLETLA